MLGPKDGLKIGVADGIIVGDKDVCKDGSTVDIAEIISDGSELGL